jgi:hypothetical protein
MGKIGGRSFSTRRSMNLTVLKILGHRVAKSDWSPGSKQVVWAAVSTAFFTSARMGELLSLEESSFDPNSTLLWGQVLFRKEGRITLHIRLPKIASKEGDFLDLYPFTEKNCCPVLALQRLFLMQHDAGMLNSALPVFCFPSGRALMLRSLNKILKTVLGDIIKGGQDSITCHSLRSAIPTTLNEAPDIARDVGCEGHPASVQIMGVVQEEQINCRFNMLTLSGLRKQILGTGCNLRCTVHQNFFFKYVMFRYNEDGSKILNVYSLCISCMVYF